MVAAFKRDRTRARQWLSAHPARLMMLTEWGCAPHHMDGFNHFLLNPYSMWLAPRGSGKSTVAVYIAAWLGIADLTSDPWDDSEEAVQNYEDRQAVYSLLFGDAMRPITPENIRVALTSSSQPNAKRLLWQVKNLLNMNAVTQCLGFQVHHERRDKLKRWTEEVSDSGYRDSTLREATWTALGMGSKVAGGHYDCVLGDDWVTLDNAQTPTQREHVADFWNFTVKGTCEPWARVGIYGTRYNPADWYGDIEKWAQEPGNKWKVLRSPAIEYNTDGSRRSYWPAAFTLAQLDAIRKEIGSNAFSTQYMNDTSVMEGDFFERHWMEQRTIWAELSKELREDARTGMALDMAFKGGEKHDWSAFTLGHMNRRSTRHPYGRFHLEKVRRGKWTKLELVKIAEEMYLEAVAAGNTPSVFAIEAQAGAEFLIQDMKRSKIIPRGIIKAMPPRISKLGRAEKTRTIFEIGAAWFDPPTAANQIQLLLDEMLAFTGRRGDIDDCVDSLVWLVIALSTGRSRLRRKGIH